MSATTPTAPAWERLLVRFTTGAWVWVWTLLPLLISAVMLFGYRGIGRYGPPDFGGFEPNENHRAALQILDHGNTDMTFHATGYAYLVALIYLVLPKLPLSVLIVQALCLPLMVRCIAAAARALGGDLAWRLALVSAGAYYPFGYYSATFTTVFPPFVALTGMVAVALPLMEPGSVSRWWLRASLSGVLLGIATCCRPYMALVGLPFALGVMFGTRSVVQTVLRVAPVAAISVAMLAGMTAANPPPAGQMVRGSQGLYRSLLLSTYQFDGVWWDWDAAADPGEDSPEWRHVVRLEAESGHPLDSPETEKLLYRDAKQRIAENPMLAIKKVLISPIRIWIFVPTHLQRMAPKIAFALSEALMLFAVLVGIWASIRRGRLFWLPLGIMAVPTLTHIVMHVEPRYSLPARGAYLAFFAVGALTLLRRWRPGAELPSTHESGKHTGPLKEGVDSALVP